MRNVRNFWISARIDGRDSTIGAGPLGKDNGFDLTVYQRREGAAAEALDILGRVNAAGELVLTVRGADGTLLAQIVTVR